jgi:hypothetical protein
MGQKAGGYEHSERNAGADQPIERIQQAVRNGILDMDNKYDQVVAPNGLAIGDQLDELARSARNMGNMTALYSVEEAWKAYGPDAGRPGAFFRIA